MSQHLKRVHTMVLSFEKEAKEVKVGVEIWQVYQCQDLTSHKHFTVHMTYFWSVACPIHWWHELFDIWIVAHSIVYNKRERWVRWKRTVNEQTAIIYIEEKEEQAAIQQQQDMRQFFTVPLVALEDKKRFGLIIEMKNDLYLFEYICIESVFL